MPWQNKTLHFLPAITGNVDILGRDVFLLYLSFAKNLEYTLQFLKIYIPCFQSQTENKLFFESNEKVLTSNGLDFDCGGHQMTRPPGLLYPH